jgi:hypothetical protein
VAVEAGDGGALTPSPSVAAEPPSRSELNGSALDEARGGSQQRS